MVTLKVMHHQCRRHHHHAKASPEVLAPDPHCLVVDQGRRQERNCSQTGPSEETNGKRRKKKKVAKKFVVKDLKVDFEVWCGVFVDKLTCILIAS